MIDDAKLGRMIVHKSGATAFRSCALLLVSLMVFGLAIFILHTGGRANSEFLFSPILWTVIGALLLLATLYGRLKAIDCYERGIVIKNLLKSQTILFEDIVVIRFLAIHRYYFLFYSGTVCYFEITPRVERSVRVNILGSENDSHQIWKIVQIILRLNPDAKLLDTY